MTFFNRQPKGIPVGGQFAATTHAEPSLHLWAGTPEIGTRDSGDMFGAAKDMFRNALQSHRTRIEARRAGSSPRTRINPVKRRLAVAALVLAASMSMTACTGQGEDCPKAADFPASSQSVAYSDSGSADIAASLPMKGGGGGHGGGGHGSSGHGTSGHASEGGSAAHEGGTTSHEGETSSGGSSGANVPHFWPWSTGGHSSQCDAHPATTQGP